MRTDKIIALCLAALSAFACTGGETVSRSEYDDLRQEYRQLKEAHEKTRSSYVSQTEEMGRILSELSAVSGKTSSLRLDVENGTARITQAEQISGHIAGIKDRIAALEQETAASDKTARKMIASLRKVIEEKEAEIAALKEEIVTKDRTIAEQSGTISEQAGTIDSQRETISAQEEELRRQVLEQARMLYEAGRDFEAIADDAPQIRRRKNIEKVEDWTLSMYRKALAYYQRAAEAGYGDAAAGIAGVSEKIAALE